jgi:hypothetical protein
MGILWPQTVENVSFLRRTDDNRISTTANPQPCQEEKTAQKHFLQLENLASMTSEDSPEFIGVCL